MVVPGQVNDSGSAVEVDARFEDTGTDANQGIGAARALVDAGYPMICGALSSEVSLQVARNVAIPNDITLCSPASTSPEITTLADDDYVFRILPSTADQGASLARVAGERMDHATAASLYQNGDPGKVNGNFTSSFEGKFGGNVLAEVPFESGQSSYTSRLETALQDDPDVLLVVANTDNGFRIFRDFYGEFDRDAMDVLVPNSLMSDTLPSDVGYDMSNVTGTAMISRGTGLEAFLEAFRDQYNRSVHARPFAIAAYDAAAVLVLANAAAGENDGRAVRDHMRAVSAEGGTFVTAGNIVEGVEAAATGESISYRGAYSSVIFDENGDPAQATYELFRYTAEDSIQILDTVRP